MDFATNFAANTAAKIAGRGLIDYAKAHTTNGHIEKGWGATSLATDTLEIRQKYLEDPQVIAFANRLTYLHAKRKELLEKIRQAKWPWSFLGRAKHFEAEAVLLKDDVISTSYTAMIKRLSSGKEKDAEVTDYFMRNLLNAVFKVLREDSKAVAGSSVHTDELASADNNRSLTPTNGSLPSELDNRLTPTDVFVMADSVPSLDCSSSITTGPTAPDCSSSIMSADSATPLIRITPTVPLPVIQSNQGRGRFGSFARRSAKESFAMKNAKGT